MDARILVIEDDERIVRMLDRFLSERGFTLRGVSEFPVTEQEIAEFAPDLILLDWNLPAQPGIEILKNIRRLPKLAHLPVIMLTARNDEIDRVEGLLTGADDYVVKPFSLAELEARIVSVLRRSVRRASAYMDDFLQIFPHDKRLVVNTVPESLTVQEWAVLEALLSSRDGMSRADLLQQVWGADRNVTERSVDVLIMRLRKVLEPEPESPRYLVTERGLGYRFARRSPLNS
jgi:DNA-binding response OmpR family regulator